jgi:hypothetical protein
MCANTLRNLSEMDLLVPDSRFKQILGFPQLLTSVTLACNGFALFNVRMPHPMVLEGQRSTTNNRKGAQHPLQRKVLDDNNCGNRSIIHSYSQKKFTDMLYVRERT